MNSVVAVMPVLVGPLQVLLALLPAILAALGGMLLAMFKPSGFKKLVRFFWHQKLFTALLIATSVALWYGYPKRLWSSPRAAGEVSDEARASAWPMLRGGPERMGWSSGDDPTAPGANWAWTDHKTVFGSPTVAGGRVYFSTVTDLGPFTPQGRGAIVCCDAESGRELWRYDDEGRYRATFSAPVVAEERVVVGEGLHITADARVTCLDLSGRKVWEYRTASHVEATPCIDNGRVYISAAGDGFYCFSLTPNEDGSPRVLWHLQGEKYPDCESSPVTDGKTVWFGLGEGGNALVAVDAATGEERWRASTPHPVFTGPTLAGGKLFIGVGNGNFIVSAEELRARQIEEMKEAGAPKAAIDAAYKELAPYGAVWCVDAETGQVDWQFRLKETVLDSIACRDGRLYFGSRDGTFYALTTDGKELAHWDAGAIILASAAAGRSHVYVATNAGRLHCLKADTLAPVWDMALQGEGVMSSSPTLAGGRVYLGTDTAGLRCVGTTEAPEPPVWNAAPVVSGNALALPERAEVAWSFPTEKDQVSVASSGQFSSQTPIMPLGDSLYFLASRNDGADLSSDSASLARLRCDGPEPVLEWTSPAPGTSSFIGSGDRILCIRDGDIETGGPRTISCRHVDDGRILWNLTTTKAATNSDREASFRNPPNGGFAIDHERAYVCSPLRLNALDLKDGAVVWSHELAPVTSKGKPDWLLPFGFGQLALQEGILVVIDAKSLAALDAPTGSFLWRQDFDGAELVDLPVCDSGQILLKTRERLMALSLTDGKPQWDSAYPKSVPFQSPIIANSEVVLQYSRITPLLARLPPRQELATPVPIPVVRRSDGQQLGQIPPPFRDTLSEGLVQLVGNRALYLGDSTIRVLDLTTNESRDWLTDERVRRPTALCELGGKLYLSAGSGIICLRGAQPGAQP